MGSDENAVRAKAAIETNPFYCKEPQGNICFITNLLCKWVAEKQVKNYEFDENIVKCVKLINLWLKYTIQKIEGVAKKAISFCFYRCPPCWTGMTQLVLLLLITLPHYYNY